ncbi:DUF1403 family protein [uncultured Sulfitobacter sp.]|uniref:DUF1403 family protein n=1 Tax=uncultured Sulfitobacter sp. TaxID=191468 RepID=UPI0030D847FA
MDFPRALDIDHSKIIPHMPSWVTSARAERIEDAAFLSGAALNHLHLLMARDDVPVTLIRARLALRAAEACVKFSGRPERAGALRDAVHFLRPGDLPGPGGEVYLSWRRAVARAVSVRSLGRALPTVEGDRIAGYLDAGQGAPITRAATVLEAMMTTTQQEGPALILADAALAQALGFDYVTPLLATGLKRVDLRKRGEDLRFACHRAVVASVVETARLVADLTRRAEHVKAVAPKLRAKGAGEAVEVFLTRDAVAAAALPLPPRAARRLCDRLVDLGAVRELTGRDMFRLYGV